MKSRVIRIAVAYSKTQYYEVKSMPRGATYEELMRLSEEVESVEALPDGKVAANLVSKKHINADALLYAVGRQGNVERLDQALWLLKKSS